MENQLTQINKLLHNLSSLESQSPSKRPVVILTDGAMNPVHNGHLGILSLAKAEIEKDNSGLEVIAGYISPSSYFYVENKLGKEAISNTHRINMVDIATKDSKWIEVEKQGVNLPSPDAFEKMEYLKEYLNSNEKITNLNIELFYLCGSDVVERYQREKIYTFNKLVKRSYKIIIVQRENNEEWKNKCKNNLKLIFGVESWDTLKQSIFFVDNTPSEEINISNISSTRVRQIISGEEKGDLENFLHPEVLKYMKENDLSINQQNMQVK